MESNQNALEFVREQDFVKYYLFPDSSRINNKEEELMLESVLKEVTIISRNLTKEYIWHKDEFKLIKQPSGLINCNDEDYEGTLPLHLYGITHFGDSIDDEWFIVYVLIELTKQINGLIVRVIDSDNEFILIEAAESLPTWAKPEVCSKRAYFYEGKLHIVAPRTDEEGNNITVSEAIKQVRKSPHLTLASSEIQDAIFKKINNYPKKIKENLHRARAYLPVAIAAILDHKPNLIAPAILAFCNRDPVDLRACRAMKYFPPEDRIYSSVTFSRLLYAMIINSKYIPERKIGWNLPPATNANYKSHLLGVKIACGFEILASQAKTPSDLECDKTWNTYLSSLKEKNYFRDLLEHSQEYDKLYDKAKDYYKTSIAPTHVIPIIGQEILHLSRTLDTNIIRAKETHLFEDDNEDWLNICPQDLEKMLQEQYGCAMQTKLTSNTDPANFSNKISNFLEQLSSAEGIEYSEQCAESSKQNSIPNNGGQQINFDPNSFSSAVQNILNFVIPEDDSWNLDSDSEIDDYGKEEEPMEYDELKSKMKDYMAEMDAELSRSTMGKSFVTVEKPSKKNDDFDDIENFKPIDIDMNALKNVLESYKAQMGEAGPSSTMLGPMGFHLGNAETSDSD